MDGTLSMDFNGLRIRLASPDDILKWSHGEITKPETINYRTFRPEKDGLFDERIFGPTKDYECYCGKYKRIRYKGIICDRCGVEVTESVVRRERMGHISLANPVAHIWYFKGANAPLSILLDVPTHALERIIYYALYLVQEVDQGKQKEALEVLSRVKDEEMAKLQESYEEDREKKIGEFAKQQESLKKRITNKEQQDIAKRELEIKEREALKILSDKFVEKKSYQTAFFDRISKVVKSLKPGDVLEEDDYLYLSEKDVEGFVQVGMGSEVLYDQLTKMDLKQEYANAMAEVAKAKSERKNKLLKKARLLESFTKSSVHPAWMMLQVLPVIPPDLRPVVQLPGGKTATSDLNDLYRRVINRNIRLKQFVELGAPDIMMRNEKRMLQEAVDSLLDLQKSKGRSRTQGAASKIAKSLSDILRGKQGRFRQNLLGKRVDYSGRSTIIGGPELKLHQCGIPKEMALELFKPHLLHEIIVRGYAPNIKSAKHFLEERDPVVYDLLEEIVKRCPVMLNRAPTLHKLSILAFYPVLTDSYAIKLHPIVCAGYNADFDGDAMGVFVPLSKQSIQEVSDRMLSYQNLIKPADGSPIAVPNKEMAVGIYYLTSVDADYVNKEDKDLKYFPTPDEALGAYDLDLIKLRQPILVRLESCMVRTTVGRVIYNSKLPREFDYVNQEVKAADIKSTIVKAINTLNDNMRVGELVDSIKNLGFMGSTLAGGLSFSVFDCAMVDGKDEMIKSTETEVLKVRDKYNEGLLTLDEKRRYTNKLWIETTEKLATSTWDILPPENPVRLSIQSGGPRASREQLKQLSAMKGLVVDPMGKIIEVPTRSNYRQGLTVLEYIISARGARKGLTDSALKTADAGYLTRRLHDVAHDMIIRVDDCGTEDGLTVNRDGERGGKMRERVRGRVALKDVLGKDKSVLVEKGEVITDAMADAIVAQEVSSVVVRTPLFCKAKHGLCQKCYGVDLVSRKLVDIGMPAGVVAAQSIGEPGTQLTMRVKHFGGIVMSDVTQGLPRVEELLETRTPKVVSPISEITGKVTVREDSDLDVYYVKTVSEEGEEQEFTIPTSQKLKVQDGGTVLSGTALSEGHLNVHDVLSIKGLNSAQMYLVNEVQDVYESQGISIHDKHFEVIVRKMSDKVIIEDEGDTVFTQDEIVSSMRFREENKKVLAFGGKPAVGRVCILGITRAAIYTESWLSAASFEQTTNVLSNAAIAGKVDPLLGLKENVIIGRLIPVTEGLIERADTNYNKSYGNNQPIGEEGAEEKGA